MNPYSTTCSNMSMRPSTGPAGGYSPGMRRVGHPRFTTALRQVEDSISAAWTGFCADSGVGPGTAETREVAEIVLQDTSEFDWRVVDGALNQLTCPGLRCHTRRR